MVLGFERRSFKFRASSLKGFPRQAQENAQEKGSESRLSSLRYECIMNCFELELGIALNHES